MNLRIELHDSEIEETVNVNEWLEIRFKKFEIIDLKDQFGLNFESKAPKRGVIRLRNPKAKTIPTAGKVIEGSVRLGDLSYENCLPLDLNVKQSCLLYIGQESGDHLLFAEEILVRVENK